MNTILATTDGPYEVHGNLEIVTAEGKLLAKESEAWLCRCGQSANKPHCDGSHKKTGFRDSSSPAPQSPGAEPAPSGVLRVGLRVNGPLRIEGRCEVRHPVVGLIFAGEQTAQCRCGHSGKKPFCDGTHRQVGFVA